MIAAFDPPTFDRQRDDTVAHEMVGSAECLDHLRRQMEVVSRRNCTVLIHGESGTGKQLVARGIHANSARAAGPFITVDCTTLPETLFESQLFGHARGAFTGAEQSTLGLFRAADGGTLFLDEIGELPLPVQAKLLRCIQEREVLPLGAVTPVRVDVRIIAATHCNLRDMLARGEFREDLFYRLNVVSLEVAPLRERRGDIVSLARNFLAEHVTQFRESPKEFTPDAEAALQQYTWPGNVRELRNVTEHAHVFCSGDRIRSADLPKFVLSAAGDHRSNGTSRAHAASRSNETTYHEDIVPLHQAKRSLLERALCATKGNQTSAARILGIERHRLARMIQRHALQPFMRSVRCE
ncbi:MAG: sigma-54-dependent Fis family transcriptional regulator [Phycisphaerales bacterium]|nr:MAG: sigma-54-dependent Fis family transcriptional regulator [Phycisphaerales bacterium]